MKNKVKNISVFILLVIVMVLQCLFLKYLFDYLQPQEKKNEKNYIMDYTQDEKMEYKVYLKPNEFIEDEYMPSGDAYLLDLIDYISINSKYNYLSTKKNKVSGTNQLKIKLIVYYKEYSSDDNKTKVLNKDELLNKKEIYFDNIEYSNENNYKLYLDKYLELLDEFQKQIKISVEGFLEISSVTDFSGNVEGTRYFDKYISTLKIPLSNSVVKIENNKSEKKSEIVYKEIIQEPNKKIIIYTVISNILLFLILCYLLKKFFIDEEKNQYQEEIEKILKMYDDIVVNVSTLIDVNEYNIVEIQEFKEILNLSRELLLPIINLEVEKNKETWFYIIKDNILYRYIVKDD